MSVVNGLYYQQLKSTVSLPSVTGSLFYFTLPWYPQSYIDEVRFWNTSGTACTVTAMLILNDGAHYRNSSTDNKGQLIYRDPTDKQTYASDAYFAAWELTPAPYSDNLYNRPFLNVLIFMVFLYSEALRWRKPRLSDRRCAPPPKPPNPLVPGAPWFACSARKFSRHGGRPPRRGQCSPRATNAAWGKASGW